MMKESDLSKMKGIKMICSLNWNEKNGRSTKVHLKIDKRGKKHKKESMYVD